MTPFKKPYKPLITNKLYYLANKKTKDFIGLLLFIVFLSLSGCTQEESLPDENGVEKENTSITDIRIEQVSLGSLENDDQIRNALAQLETVKKTTTSKNTPSNIYDFKVDTSNIKVINQGDIKSYTFLVKERTDSLYFDNLVLQQKYNGEPEAFLIRYYNENGIRRIPDHSSFTFE